MNSLNVKAWLGLISVTVVMALLLFLPAGTMRYWQAWLFLCIYFVTSVLTTLYAMKYYPELLKRRMRGGPAAEKETAQKIIMSFMTLAFVACLVIPALDFRLGWSHVPAYLTIVGNVLVVLFFYTAYLAFRENQFAAATVEVEKDQQVISSGVYAVIRHPMYAGGLALFVGMPPALGSYWGFLALVIAVPALVLRLLDEERFLTKNLPGYTDYCAKVRWRMIPGVY